MQNLLTFTGYHDPYNNSNGAGEKTAGPILTVLANKSFQRVILFYTKSTLERSVATKEKINHHYPDIEVATVCLQIKDPTNHLGILRQLRIELKEHAPTSADSQYSISISSGTPHMHACWLLLVASGELTAKILQPQRPEHVKPGKSPVQEINLTAPDFPHVTTALKTQYDEPDTELIYRAANELNIIGDSPVFEKVLEEAYCLSQYDEHILLLGETGTGKEKITEFIHHLSKRSKRPLTIVNCGAIPENLAESVLFGHLKGSFSGATQNCEGKFKTADQGILFLDEIGELPPHIQTKLLRAIQQGEIDPIGSKRSTKVNVQVIAATNKDIITMIKGGEFREDLYQRFVTTLELPSLSERRDDIPLIAKSILDQWNKLHDKNYRFSTEAVTQMIRHTWPGNVRDLRNLVTRSAMFAKAETLSPTDLKFTTTPSVSLSLPELTDDFEMLPYLAEVKDQLIHRALDISNQNKAKAARLLGWTPQALSNHFTRKNQQT